MNATADHPNRALLNRAVPFSLCALSLLLLASPGAAQERSQGARVEALEITAEVLEVDEENRIVGLAGPLGGLLLGAVSDDVKDLSKIEVGGMVSATYYQAIAVAAHRKGEDRPLFTAGRAGDRSASADSVSASESYTKTVTVASVDVLNRTLVLANSEGDLFTTEVRPEFVDKLKDLKHGDQLDITYSDAVFLDLRPATPGAVADIKMKLGTLVIDNGVVVNRTGKTILVRNDSGRIIKAVVDPDFKFKLNDKDATVFDLKKGDRISRTAIRVEEVSYSGS